MQPLLFRRSLSAVDWQGLRSSFYLENQASSSVRPSPFSLGHPAFLESRAYLPKTTRLNSIAYLYLSRSSRAFLKTSLLTAFQNCFIQIFAPTSDAGRRAFALSSNRRTSVVQKSSCICRAVTWDSLKSSGNLSTICLAAWRASRRELMS